MPHNSDNVCLITSHTSHSGHFRIFLYLSLIRSTRFSSLRSQTAWSRVASALVRTGQRVTAGRRHHTLSSTGCCKETKLQTSWKLVLLSIGLVYQVALPGIQMEKPGFPWHGAVAHTVQAHPAVTRLLLQHMLSWRPAMSRTCRATAWFVASQRSTVNGQWWSQAGYAAMLIHIVHSN